MQSSRYPSKKSGNNGLSSVDITILAMLLNYLSNVTLPPTKSELFKATNRADQFVALMSVGLFTTRESRQNAISDRPENIQRHSECDFIENRKQSKFDWISKQGTIVKQIQGFDKKDLYNFAEERRRNVSNALGFDIRNKTNRTIHNELKRKGLFNDNQSRAHSYRDAVGLNREAYQEVVRKQLKIR